MEFEKRYISPLLLSLLVGCSSSGEVIPDDGIDPDVGNTEDTELGGNNLPGYANGGGNNLNVVFIMVDDMNNYGVLNRYSQIKTPNINKLRDESTLFTKSVCAAPVSVPSRTSCFSGLYPCNTGAYLNDCDGWIHSDALMNTASLFEWFGDNGYYTWGSGKAFHSPLPNGRKAFDNPNVPGSSGFGPFVDNEGGFYAIHPWPDEEDTSHPDNKTTEAAIEFLSQDHNTPFLLYAGLWKPHTPYTSPKRFFDLYNVANFEPPAGWKHDDFNDIPDYGEGLVQLGRVGYKDKDTWGDWMEYIKAYCANCSFADWNVGRILDALENSKYVDNTIVVFCSDNGFHCGEKLHWQKGTLWEQAAYVPMMIREPKQREAKVCNRPVGLIDLYPTLLEMCGLRSPMHKLDGRSIVPLLANPDAAWDYPAITMYGTMGDHIDKKSQYYKEGMDDMGNISIRNERYRFIQYCTGDEELYDLETDPYEFTNLSTNAEYNPIMEDMRQYIPKSWKTSVGGRWE